MPTLEVAVTGAPYPHGVPLRHRRLLLALLTGATNLSGYPACRVAHVGPATFYPVTERLERAGWVTSRWEQDPPPKQEGRRRFYELTWYGRAMTLNRLGLDPPAGYPDGPEPAGQPPRLHRSDDLVLLALATGSPLWAGLLYRVTTLGHLRLYRALDRLENAGLITGEQEPYAVNPRRFYRLVNRPYTMRLLRLETGGNP
jgi:DNA-binding PadR family transcriptional regulator